MCLFRKTVYINTVPDRDIGFGWKTVECKKCGHPISYTTYGGAIVENLTKSDCICKNELPTVGEDLKGGDMIALNPKDNKFYKVIT